MRSAIDPSTLIRNAIFRHPRVFIRCVFQVEYLLIMEALDCPRRARCGHDTLLGRHSMKLPA